MKRNINDINKLENIINNTKSKDSLLKLLEEITKDTKKESDLLSIEIRKKIKNKNGK